MGSGLPIFGAALDVIILDSSLLFVVNFYAKSLAFMGEIRLAIYADWDVIDIKTSDAN